MPRPYGSSVGHRSAITTVITEQLITEKAISKKARQNSAEGIDQSVKQRHHRQLGAISSTKLVFGVDHMGLHRFH